MKNLLAIVMLFANMFANAQVTNTDFENWTNSEPTGWWSIDNLIPLGFCEESSDAQSGSKAAKLTVQSFQGSPFATAMALSDFTDESTEAGIPYTERPTDVTFWAKYTLSGNDSLVAGAILYKWTGTERIVVGEGGVILTGSQSNYTLQSATITYNTTDTPDSLQILFLVGKPELGEATLGSEVWIDNLEVVGGSSSGPPAAPSNLVATPQKTAANNGILLTWQDNSNNETQFVIERSTTQSGSYSEIGTTATNENSYLDNTTNDNTTYYYRVYASNNDGNSNVSNIADATAGTSVGIENSIAEIIQLYPNPNTGKFNIILPENLAVANVKIFSILGEELFSDVIENHELSINLNVANGNYIVAIQHKSLTMVKRLTINK